MRIEDLALVRIPNAKLRLLLRMAKTLVRDAPATQNEPVKAALAKLVEHIDLVHAALSLRVRLKNPHLLARELEFDRAVDSLWIFLREYLAMTSQAFGHAGLNQLSEARQAEIDLPELRELAATASAVHEQLFAADGTNFVKFALSAQAEEMAALLRVVEEDQLADEIEQVAGDRILEAIVVCQAQYEELVNDRMRRELGVTQDFRELRRRMRWLLSRYKNALETLYDEDAPETAELISTALRALLIVSALTSRGSSVPGAELEAELVQTPEFDALDEFALDESTDATDSTDSTDSIAPSDSFSAGATA